ncbi:helix-turn-helix transcriptional regulator [Nocardiopsis alba]|uniref:helix-turn-helix domain-containing protein n=1 Tax=Nocardiopsis alba TaxID=53437 RepID=UPI0033DFBE0C
MIDDRGPVVHQALLIHRLIALRRDNGLTQEKVARSLEWSHAKLMRYEGGTQVLPKADLDALLDLYRVLGTAQGRKLQEIGRRARDKPWWYPHRHALSVEERHYVGLEMGAARIRQCAPLLVPGLLRTRDYAQALCSMVDPGGEVGRLVDVLMGRQGVMLTRSPVPEQVYVLDEAALRRIVGGRENPEVQLRQLYHLVERSASVQLHIIPEEAGLHSGTLGGFTLFDFDEGLPPVLHTEHRGRVVASKKEEDTRAYAEAFDRLVAEHALDTCRSLALIEHHARRLQDRINTAASDGRAEAHANSVETSAGAGEDPGVPAGDLLAVSEPRPPPPPPFSTGLGTDAGSE